MTRLRTASLVLLAVAAAALLACDSDSIVATGGDAICEGYPPVEGSPYVLPYPVGASYSVLTANCDLNHVGANRYGYDFRMPSGTPLVAIRGGTVAQIDESHSDRDNESERSNLLVIDHGDGTVSTYFHMRRNGVVVELGERVERGQLVAYSGASGTGTPHLHVHVRPCQEGVVYCLSAPFQFVNADPRPAPTGLQRDVIYTALPYDETMGFLEAVEAPATPTGGEGTSAPALGRTVHPGPAIHRFRDH